MAPINKDMEMEEDKELKESNLKPVSSVVETCVIMEGAKKQATPDVDTVELPTEDRTCLEKGVGESNSLQQDDGAEACGQKPTQETSPSKLEDETICQEIFEEPRTTEHEVQTCTKLDMGGSCANGAKDQNAKSEDTDKQEYVEESNAVKHEAKAIDQEKAGEFTTEEYDDKKECRVDEKNDITGVCKATSGEQNDHTEV